MEYEIKCAFCGEAFQASKSNAKFCSGNCRTNNHNASKKVKETLEIVETKEKSEVDNQTALLRVQISEAERTANYYHRNWSYLKKRAANTQKRIDYLKYHLQVKELDIEEAKSLIKRLEQKSTAISKTIGTAYTSHKKDLSVSGMKRHLDIMIAGANSRDTIISHQNKVEELLSKISKTKYLLIKINHELGLRRSSMERMTKDRDNFFAQYQETVKKIEALKHRLTKPKFQPNHRTIVPQFPINKPKRRSLKKDNSNLEIGAGDLQDMNFNTFELPSELGRFLGNLDWNRTCFALTGDSGAGKTYFSFELAKLFTSSLNLNAKYFSLEEGIGKLTQEKVAQYNLGNELSIVSKGELSDVRIAAKNYQLIIVDSFNKLNAKAADFEALRTDFPKTLFILIFQKTASGTMRGGSSIKYDSSATINVIKRDGERIAIMEKGRYGTIGWEYSIDEGRVIKED